MILLLKGVQAMAYQVSRTGASLISMILCVVFVVTCSGKKQKTTNDEETMQKVKTGSVIFIHPDGSGASMWGALRLLETGPDGKTNWDTMEHMGLYRGHLRDSTNSSSNAGATVHAFGVKGTYGLFGINPKSPFISLSGKDYSIMTEAKMAGTSIAIINSGHICEPGTAVFLSNAENRAMTDTISEQIILSGADIILSGGEEYLLPEGVPGRHGKPGSRKDGKNLIVTAEKYGYTVVYTRDELFGLPVETEKVLGVFSASHTFNDLTEEELREQNLPLFNENAPTVAEMTEAALTILHRKQKDFFMVVEEEGTDNFSNANNAKGALEALGHADEAIGIAMSYIDNNPETLLVTAADSDAGGMQVMSIRDPESFEKPLPAAEKNGAPIDGRDGSQTQPFIAAPDQFGTRLRFGITWAGSGDYAGAVIAKAHGLNAELLPANVDNTDIYRIMYATLFGVWPESSEND